MSPSKKQSPSHRQTQKPAGRRTEQLDALLKERIDEFLLKHLELPGVLVTVTQVKTSHDLHHARALVTVLPEDRRGTALERLRGLAKELNEELFHELSIRPVPRVNFAYDNLEDEASQIEELLDNLAHPS